MADYLSNTRLDPKAERMVKDRHAANIRHATRKAAEPFDDRQVYRAAAIARPSYGRDKKRSGGSR
jgi:hypothetical protein